MTRSKRMMQSLSTLTAVEVISRVFPLITLHHAEKILGIQNFGAANFGMSLFDLAMPFIGMGYATHGAIHVAKLIDKKLSIDEAVSSIISLRLLHALAAVLVLLGLVHLNPHYSGYEKMVLCLSFLPFLSAFDCEFLFAATQKMKTLSIINLVMKLIGLFTILIAVKTSDDVIFYSAIVFGVNAGISLGSYFLNRSRFSFRPPKWESMTSMFFSALPLNISMLILWTSDRSDLVVVKATADGAALGVYAGSYRIVQSLYPMVASFSRIFFSEMLKDGEKESLTKFIEYEILLVFGLLAPMAIGSWFTGSDLLQFLYSDNFRNTGPLLAIMLGTLTAMSWINVFGYQILVSKEESKVLNISVLVAFVFGVILGGIGGHLYGIYGVALGFLISKIIAATVVTVRAKKYLIRLPWPIVGKTLIASFIMATALQFFSTKFWILDILFGGGVYAVFMTLLNRKLIRNALAHRKG